MSRDRPDTVRFEELGFDLFAGPAVLMTQPHRHNDIEMTLLEKGWIDYLFGGVRIRIPAGVLCVRWAAIPHQSVAFKEPSIHYSLKIPFAWFMRWDPPPEIVEPLLGGRMLLDRETVSGCQDEAMFRRWRAIFRQNGPGPGRIVALEAEARLRRIALRLRPGGGRKAARVSDRAQLGTVERMTVFIARNHTRPLDIATIAEAVGLHPNSAMRLFRRTCGMTLHEFINLHRIWQAQRLLTTTTMKVQEVAEESGFGSPARFYAAFRKIVGQTPGEYLAALGR
ncbi:MAG: helix-turn-helix domain-containing protein [Verrucomicrobia bacterium]|nr:helix-turn-helix domain-containing protein [Verrucomicrobiota bacterium]